jgi:primosomal protein N' (replication factor Y)
VLENSFNQFVERELKERREFNYPPFFRLIQVTVLHKDDKITAAAAWLAANLRSKLGPDRVLGPVLPATARLRNLYQQHILLKLEKNIQLIQDAKGLIQFLEQQLVGKSGWGQVRLVVDVDPI